MKNTEEIKQLISNLNVSDETVRKEIEKLDPKEINKEVQKEILSLLEEKRPDLFNKWQLEVASEYM